VLEGELNISQENIHSQKITYDPEITLAMYRELAAHIEQIQGVIVELFSQDSKEFNYLGSQIGGMWLTYPQEITIENRELISRILNYYGSWKLEDCSNF
jgi:hypothetical protein